MKAKASPALISHVQAGSIAEEMNLQPGDKLIAVNGIPLRDILDFYGHICNQELSLEIEKNTGENWVVQIEKDADEPLGLFFSEECFDGLLSCTNKCLFCFIKGLPKGMRRTLYIKDDDYRHSFLHGNYITLTNLSQKDLQRIVDLKLSPLYISVHTTNATLRKYIMGNHKSGDILEKLKFLSENGIEMHTQAVVCPAINDGTELDRTINDLAQLFPNILSLAVVPVGITRYNLNEGLGLRPYTATEALAVVEIVEKWQNILLEANGSRFVFVSDEFYLKAGKNIPEDSVYEDYPQFENGVGLVRSFWDDFSDAWQQIGKSLPDGLAGRLIILTGVLAAPVLAELLKKHAINSRVQVLPVENKFFGASVTVTGLLTGADIIETLKGTVAHNDNVLISDVVLKNGADVLLDNFSLKQIEKIVGVKITAVRNNGKALAEMLSGGGSDV